MKCWEDLLFTCSLNNVLSRCVPYSLPCSAWILAWASICSHLASLLETCSFSFFFPSTLPSKSCLPGVSITPFFSCGLLFQGPCCLEQKQGKAGPELGAWSSQTGWRWASWLQLQALIVHWHKITHCRSSFSITSGTSELFSITWGRTLCLPWLVCLVSAWVLRGERDLWHLRHSLRFSRNGTGNICAFPSGVTVGV